MTSSVAMCTYNGEKNIYEQLSSIAAQTIVPDEIVICDDGSTDDTVAIIERFSQEHAVNISLHINENNLGFRKNFEKCIGLCCCEIIFLCDQDDVWMPTKVEEFYRAFADKSVVYAFSDATVVDSEKNEIGASVWAVEWDTLTKDQMFNYFLKLWFPLGFSAAVRADFAKAAMPFKTDHDGWLALLAPIYGEIAPINKKLALYRRHVSATSQAYIKKGVLTVLQQYIKQVRMTPYNVYFLYSKEYGSLSCHLLEMITENKSTIDTTLLRKKISYHDHLNDVCDKNVFARLSALRKMKQDGSYQQFRSASNKAFLLDVGFMIINSFKRKGQR